MESLCTDYWRPLYSYLRRNHSQHEAEDLTQEFFDKRVLTQLIFRGVDRSRGTFRTWLLNSLRNFVLNEIDRQRAQKRGGGQPHLPFDFESGEACYAREPASDHAPEKIYDRAWARALIERALAQLRADYERDGKAALFNELQCCLTGAVVYAEVALRLGKSEDAVKMDVNRLRKACGAILRTEINRTVSSPAEFAEEWRYLRSMFVE